MTLGLSVFSILPLLKHLGSPACSGPALLNKTLTQNQQYVCCQPRKIVTHYDSCIKKWGKKVNQNLSIFFMN